MCYRSRQWARIELGAYIRWTTCPNIYKIARAGAALLSLSPFSHLARCYHRSSRGGNINGLEMKYRGCQPSTVRAHGNKEQIRTIVKLQSSMESVLLKTNLSWRLNFSGFFFLDVRFHCLFRGFLPAHPQGYKIPRNNPPRLYKSGEYRWSFQQRNDISEKYIRTMSGTQRTRYNRRILHNGIVTAAN